MFGNKRAQELEVQILETRRKAENAEKEKDELQKQLKSAQDRISDLEKKLAESEGSELKEQADKAIAEYQGLKELYLRKNQELDDTREATEEGFAIEAADKRRELKEEIRVSREDNQKMVSETVQTFASSYQYYLDQVRGLMDAISAAARETGETLFSGEPQNIKERFGARILEHLQSNAGTLPQDTGDLLLIGAEEAAAEAPAEAPAAAPAETAPQATAETVEPRQENSAEENRTEENSPEANSDAPAGDAAETPQERAEEA